jgi:lipoate-protein ligase B
MVGYATMRARTDAEGESVNSSGTLRALIEAAASSDRRSSDGILLTFSTLVPYSTAWELQSRFHRERQLDLRPDTVLILEHQPVYTLGRTTKPSDWGGNEAALRANGADLWHVNRGGSVTYHGPGQIVAYPIIRLSQHAAGPRQLVWQLEEVMIRLLAKWNIAGCRIDKRPGVWVMKPTPAKIASIGLRIHQGITLHGFALNVDMDLEPFRRIHPCGLPHCPVTSMATLLNTEVPMNEIKNELAHIWSTVFAIEWTLAVGTLDGYVADAGDTTPITAFL